jgi:hypothetical protein
MMPNKIDKLGDIDFASFDHLGENESLLSR